MIPVADEYLRGLDGGALHLCMAPETKVRIPLSEQLLINGPVGGVAHGAALPQSRMFENEGPGLLTMAGGAGLVGARHRQPARGFENIGAVGIVALGAAHLVLKERMVLGQMKLRFDGAVAFKTGGGIFARVDNKLAASAPAGDVEATSSVTGFAACLSGSARVFQPDPRMGAAWKDAANIRVTFGTAFIADKGGTGNLRRSHQCHGSGRARVQ